MELTQTGTPGGYQATEDLPVSHFNQTLLELLESNTKRGSLTGSGLFLTHTDKDGASEGHVSRVTLLTPQTSGRFERPGSSLNRDWKWRGLVRRGWR